MHNDIEIVPLTLEPRDVKRFLNLSYSIYGDDPNWVAPLLSDLRKVFTSRNPLFEHAAMQLWIARRDGRDVGRIAGIHDRHHKEVAKEDGIFFGFFECTHDRHVCDALFGAVTDWARKRGGVKLLGPMNPTSNDECGLLVDGFDSPPVFMMTYNPRYYVELVEGAGFAKAKDLLAFMIPLEGIPMDRLVRIADKVRARAGVTLRAVTKKSLDTDVVKIKEIYNAAWQDNWGFVPMTDPEVDFMAERLKPLLMEGLVWLAEKDSDAVGFLLAIPDYNVAIQPLKGRLLTPKLFGFIPYLLGWKYPPRTRVITLGVRDGYRSKGLESAMLVEGLKAGIGVGVTESEASWILEDNVMMCRIIESIGGKVYKTYRIYEKSI